MTRFRNFKRRKQCAYARDYDGRSDPQCEPICETCFVKWSEAPPRPIKVNQMSARVLALTALVALSACSTGPHSVDWNQYRQDASHAPLIVCAMDPERITLYPPPHFRSPIDGKTVRGEVDERGNVRVIRKRATIYHELVHRGLRMAGIELSEADEELFVIRYLSVHFPGIQNSTTSGADRRDARERWSEEDVINADKLAKGKGCE